MVGELRGPLPIKVDATSNGEFRPVPLAEHVARANREAERRIGEASVSELGAGRSYNRSAAQLPRCSR
jgi:hypothetical protein